MKFLQKYLLIMSVTPFHFLFGADNIPPKNILIFIFDDYGVLSAESYKDLWQSSSLAPTPTFNKLCSEGVRFNKVWANPTCSPTRTNILTGRYSFRTGVGEPCGRGANEIRPEELTIPKIIAQSNQNYALGSVGKWHLGTDEDKQGTSAPNFMGWEYFSGILRGGLRDYFQWDRVENGKSIPTENYATSQNIDDAIKFLSSTKKDQPFLMWVAFNAPHTPIHLPPKSLHSFDQLPGDEDDIENNPLPYYEAMVESADTEMSRLIEYIRKTKGQKTLDNTLIIVMGDNGTANGRVNLLPKPYSNLKGKGTLYNHGIQVPLCITGSGVDKKGTQVEELVNIADIFQTVLDYTDSSKVTLPKDLKIDSLSLKGYLNTKFAAKPRKWIFSEQFSIRDGGKRHKRSGITIRDLSHKFIYFPNKKQSQNECYNLKADPLEQENILNQKTGNSKCKKLENAMRDLICSTKNEWTKWCNQNLEK